MVICEQWKSLRVQVLIVKVANTGVAFLTNGFPLVAYQMNAGSIMQAFSLKRICLFYVNNAFTILESYEKQFRDGATHVPKMFQKE